MSQWRERIAPVIINVRKFFRGLIISFLAMPIINNVMAAKMPRMATIQNGDTLSLPYRAALPKMMAAMLMAIRPLICCDIVTTRNEKGETRNSFYSRFPILVFDNI